MKDPFNDEMNIVESDTKPEPLNLNTNSGTITIDTSSGITFNDLNNTTGTWPYWYYPHNYSYTPTPWVTIDRAENGFIVRKGGKTFVCKKEEDVVKFLKEEE